MPRSPKLSFRHMSHSPAAHAGHGTGSGLAHDPDDQITGRKARPGWRLEHLAQTLVAR